MTTKLSDGEPGRLAALRQALLEGYKTGRMWGHQRPSAILPEGVERGSDLHLIFLTLVMTVAADRQPSQLWEAARSTWAEDPALFDPKYLAYLPPGDLKQLQPRLQKNRLAFKPRSEATTWQRIGKALVMRGGGSVKALLDKYSYSAGEMMGMLKTSKTTFPVLAGEQTAPRWLYALSVDGGIKLEGVEQLRLPLSEAGKMALSGLQINTSRFTAPVFDPLDTLGRLGCAQRQEGAARCPAAGECPVAEFCQFGSNLVDR